MACPGVRGLHDLRTRDSGDRTFVEFHMEVDPHLTITQGHAISDAAETAVRELFLPQVVEVISGIRTRWHQGRTTRRPGWVDAHRDVKIPAL